MIRVLSAGLSEPSGRAPAAWRAASPVPGARPPSLSGRGALAGFDAAPGAWRAGSSAGASAAPWPLAAPAASASRRSVADLAAAAACAAAVTVAGWALGPCSAGRGTRRGRSGAREPAFRRAAGPAGGLALTEGAGDCLVDLFLQRAAGHLAG